MDKYTLTFTPNDPKDAIIVFTDITSVEFETDSISGKVTTMINNQEMSSYRYKIGARGVYYFFSDGESQGSFMANSARAVHIEKQESFDL